MGLPSEFYQWLDLVLLAAISFFLKRLVSRQDSFEKEIGGRLRSLEQDVAVILDRDRRKRIEDYDREDKTIR